MFGKRKKVPKEYHKSGIIYKDPIKPVRQEEKEIVICSAVKAENGRIFRGHRHGDAMRACLENKCSLSQTDDQQGFITSKNRYVGREEGRRLQDEAGIKSADSEGYRGSTLFSEDLY